MAGKRKLALITGAAGGIGSATARLFEGAGWDAIAVDRKEADISRLEDIDRLVQSIRSTHTSLDALINIAAEQIAKPLIQTEPAEWDHLMSTNLRAIYLLTSRLHPLLKAAGGCVVNVASVHAVATSRGMAAYVASKGAVVALTRAVALELAEDGIRVNAVLPGAIDTPMLAEGLKRSPSQTLETLAARHPLKRIGKPADVAEAIYFLADSRRASFITGQTLVVDGGATAKLSTES
jgi:glucose 1-dehydrogenase